MGRSERLARSVGNVVGVFSWALAAVALYVAWRANGPVALVSALGLPLVLLVVLGLRKITDYATIDQIAARFESRGHDKARALARVVRVSANMLPLTFALVWFGAVFPVVLVDAAIAVFVFWMVSLLGMVVVVAWWFLSGKGRAPRSTGRS